MTLHIRGIHCADHFRADVRAAQRQQDNTTEELRTELESVRPLLRWPIKKGPKHDDIRRTASGAS